jgi:hypothetical protein
MKFILFILSIACFSCINNKLNNSYSFETSSSIESNQPQLEILNFEDYWKEFGVAIQTSDTNKIKSLTLNPLDIFGSEDQDPNLKVKSNEIVKFIMIAVNNGGYYDLGKDTSISNRTLLLSDLKSISEYKQDLDSQWINDFVFKKTANGWKLVTLFMNTKSFKTK